MMNLLLSPLSIFFLFILLGVGFFALVQKIAAPGKDHVHKREPYACGEDLETTNILLTYHSFFRVALLFGILHIVALVISTIPGDLTRRGVAITYVAAAAVAMIILFEREGNNE